jgi:hypothetical protein
MITCIIELPFLKCRNPAASGSLSTFKYVKTRQFVWSTVLSLVDKCGLEDPKTGASLRKFDVMTN